MHRFDGMLIEDEELRAMASTLRHRGPDESGIWNGRNAGFAHTRLSIIDIAGSHQPMRSHDGRWTIAFNGEIFNFAELRGELNYPFQTSGDTEVILAGLTIYGIDFVRRLRGQFAFAAHDSATGTTHLVRDRLGILPLYYAIDSTKLLFGSEIKALNAVRAPAVDMASLDAYLSARSVAAPHTLVAGVKKLLPAHRARIDANGRMAVVRYWSPPPVERGRTWSDDDAVDAVDEAIRDAVRSALVADVPVGAYLSGGVDSSLIVAIMQDLRGAASVNTFSAGFGDPRFDELSWARQVSETVGTKHHVVDVRATDFEELWPRLTWHRDAPISEPADIAVFRLAERAREEVTVVLSGEGGDELFGGYPKYRLARPLHWTGNVPPPLRSRVLQSIEPHMSGRAARARVAVRAAAAKTEAERLQTWFAPFTSAERRSLLVGVPIRADQTDVQGDDPVDRMLRHDLTRWLPDNLLERGDRMSMASSLELRPPLLDHRLVELAFGLPSDLKVRRGTTKWILKEVARRYLPSTVVDRRKVGFRVPLDSWFREGLRDVAWDRLTSNDSFVGQCMDRKMLRNLLVRHDGGRYNEESRIWTLMSLEVWHETVIRPSAQSF